MRSKWSFLPKNVSVILAVVSVSAALVFCISFVVFVLHETGVWYAPPLGLRGIFIFLSSIPWVLVGAIALCLILLEWLLKRYAFAYSRPLLYTALGVLLFGITFGFVVARTPLHADVLRHAHEGRAPVIGSMYRGFCSKRFHDVHRGVVVEVYHKGFCIQNDRGDMVTVVSKPNIRLPDGSTLAEGEPVWVYGKKMDEIIMAFGVRKIKGNIPPIMVQKNKRCKPIPEDVK